MQGINQRPKTRRVAPNSHSTVNTHTPTCVLKEMFADKSLEGDKEKTKAGDALSSFRKKTNLKQKLQSYCFHYVIM